LPHILTFTYAKRLCYNSTSMAALSFESAPAPRSGAANPTEIYGIRAPALDSRKRLLDWFFCGAILAGLVGIFYMSVSGGVFQPLLESVRKAEWSEAFARPCLLWGLMGTLFLGFRTILWLFYRPYAPAGLRDAPSVTVIIPAYNEGAMVQNAIYSVLASRYPRDRIEVFVVDDGSGDDTWQHIQAAAKEHGKLVTPVHFNRNRGKRAALEEGFRRARGDIVVTVDSDSVVEPDTLLALVGPFRDAKVGAVAGKVLVYNQSQGIIPRMLHVKYVLSFDFLRAVQSTYGTVYCCPGALSAYRTSVVRSILPLWIDQKFLGLKCTFGEDRAMTNYILSIGYNTVYQRTARVHTVVPWTYEKLCKMYLRWDRSYIREVIRFSRIAWKRPPLPRIISLTDLVITNLRYPVGWASLALFSFLSMNDPATILRLFCAIGLFSCLNMLYYLYSERSWLFFYGILYSYFSFLTLFWVFPYAVVTVRARTWGTR
jgi:hyaluronan synthase